MKTMIKVAIFIAISTTVYAKNGLWTEGKDAPEKRVNTNVKALAPQVYTSVADSVSHAVVNISTTKTTKSVSNPFGMQKNPRDNGQGRGQNPFEDFFDQFFNAPNGQMPRDRKQQGMGSGFVLNEEGYIVTNNHVVEGADEIKVTFSDETELPAKVIGRDAKTDVALLKVDMKKKVKSVILGDSKELKVGDIVVAIGNPFGLSHSVTQGIVSAKERSIGFGAYDDFIQTDASINPGNSGGPLLNIQGEVVGINTAIVASGQGIGFAIPINLAKSIIQKLRSDGKVIRGWLGVQIQKVTAEHASALKLSDNSGALVSDVQKNSPASKAGLVRGDVIVEVDGKKIKDWHELPILVANIDIGKTVKVIAIRDGAKKNFDVKIEKLDEKTEEVASAQETKADELGMKVETVTKDLAKMLGLEDTSGVVVTYVDPNSSAAAKVKQRDVILEVNRKKVDTVADYVQHVKGLKKGSDVLLLVRRGNSNVYVAFQL